MDDRPAFQAKAHGVVPVPSRPIEPGLDLWTMTAWGT